MKDEEKFTIDVNSATATPETLRASIKRLLVFGGTYEFFDQETLRIMYDALELSKD